MDDALWHDIERLSRLLAESLERNQGPDIPALMAEIRASVVVDPDETAARIRDLSVARAMVLARGLGLQFQLTNIAEQVHRARVIRAERSTNGGPIATVVRRIQVAHTPTAEVQAVVDRMSVRPVLTAHPTEAARRSVLLKLRQIADLLAADDAVQADQRIGALIDLLWQTDELRVERPQVIDEARNAIYYLDELGRGSLADVLRLTKSELARLDVHLPDARSPIQVRILGRWRSRRQSQRHPRGHRGGPVAAPSTRGPRLGATVGQVGRGPVDLGSARARQRRTSGLGGARHRAPTGAGPARCAGLWQ